MEVKVEQAGTQLRVFLYQPGDPDPLSWHKKPLLGQSTAVIGTLREASSAYRVGIGAITDISLEYYRAEDAIADIPVVEATMQQLFPA